MVSDLSAAEIARLLVTTLPLKQLKLQIWSPSLLDLFQIAGQARRKLEHLNLWGVDPLYELSVKRQVEKGE